MKVLKSALSITVLVALMAGCASDVVFIPKVPVDAQMKLLDYYKQPDNKVFVLAVDPGGDFAYAYDYGKATLKDAAKTAVEKCDVQRENQSIVAKTYIYAINNKVVYREMIRKEHEAEDTTGTTGQEAQIDEAARQEATGEAAETAEAAEIDEVDAADMADMADEAEVAFEEM